MKPYRRRLVCWVACAAVLFTQLAASAHACVPNLAASDPSASAAATLHCPDKTHGPDRERANHCVQHCQVSAQSVDRGHATIVPAAPAPVLTVLWRAPLRAFVAMPRAQTRSASFLPPSLYLVNCSFRT